MKRCSKLLIIFALLVLLTASAVADRGVDPTYETQGIMTSTTIIAVGNFESHTDFAAESLDGTGADLNNFPPLGADNAYYSATYSADTMSSGTGLINFDRSFEADSGGQLLGQYNLESTMLLGYYGIDGGRVVSSESIMVSSAANPAGGQYACPFANAAAPNGAPAYCNRAMAGSSIDMSIVSVRTDSNARWIMSSGDYPVELNHNIRVSDYDGIPSHGMASAFMNVLIQEARTGTAAGGGGAVGAPSGRIEFHERTSIDGDITLFERLQHYESGAVR